MSYGLVVLLSGYPRTAIRLLRYLGLGWLLSRTWRFGLGKLRRRR